MAFGFHRVDLFMRRTVVRVRQCVDVLGTCDAPANWANELNPMIISSQGIILLLFV